MTQTAKGYSDHRWATYKQIKDMGGQVRKGEKATHVLFYKFDDETQKAQDQPNRPATEGKAEREHTRPPMVRGVGARIRCDVSRQQTRLKE